MSINLGGQAMLNASSSIKPGSQYDARASVTLRYVERQIVSMF